MEVRSEFKFLISTCEEECNCDFAFSQLAVEQVQACRLPAVPAAAVHLGRLITCLAPSPARLGHSSLLWQKRTSKRLTRLSQNSS